MLLFGYCFGIRSERRLCEEVHLNLAYRWFCRLDLSDRVPDHLTFSKNWHGRFRESELLRHLFETTIARCIEEDLINARKHGRNPGRPTLPPETISALQDLVAVGKSVAQAARHLGIARSTAYSFIRNTTQ